MNPFDDPQMHELEGIMTRLSEDLTASASANDVVFETLKSLCAQSRGFRSFARLCSLRAEAERLRGEVAATRKAAKDTLLQGAVKASDDAAFLPKEEDTINL